MRPIGRLAAAVAHPPGAMGAPATSAAHVLALLDEDDDSLKLHALQQLDRSVHDFWFQISSSIAAIEALYEDEEFSHRELAALVASKVRSRGLALLGSAICMPGQPAPGDAPWAAPPRAPPTERRVAPPPTDLRSRPAALPALHRQVFYHLGDLDDALSYALGAGGLFDVNARSEYVQTILGESQPPSAVLGFVVCRLAMVACSAQQHGLYTFVAAQD